MEQFITKEGESNQNEFDNLTEKLLFSNGELGLSSFMSGRFTPKPSAEYDTFIKQQEKAKFNLENTLKNAKPCPFCNTSDNLSIYMDESRNHNDSGFNNLGVKCSCGGAKNSGIYGYGSPSAEQKMKAIEIWNTRS